MSLDEKLKKALKELNKIPAQVFTATVKSLNEVSKTISVIDVDNLQFDNVRLAAAEDPKKSVMVIPKVNSTVLVSMIGNDLNTLFVCQVNEVEKITGEIDQVKFNITSDGYQITKGDESLKTVLNDYIDEVNKIKVIYGNTINVAATNTIKARLNQILIE